MEGDVIRMKTLLVDILSIVVLLGIFFFVKGCF